MKSRVENRLSEEAEMAQCEHDFQLDLEDGQVKCTKCGDLDDEMQLPNLALERQDEKDDFEKSQINFE